MVKAKVFELLRSSLDGFDVKDEEIELEHPANLDHGDYSTNIALKLSKKVGKNPKELADEISSKINKGDVVERIEVVNGFINFFLSKKLLFEELNKVVSEKEKYGKKNSKKFTVLLEYGQPNTHKAPHVGHLFSYIYGESLSRILEHEGYDVKRLNYQGDIGLHVAKCLFAVKKHEDELDGLKTLKEKVDFLQKCYVEGSEAYEKGSEKEIDELNKKIYDKEEEIVKLWEETRSWSVDFYKEFEERLGINYDKYYFESQVAEKGKGLVKENTGKVFEESEGAVVFRGDKQGLHTRVFINKHGNPTYEAKDIGLISMKNEDFKFDLSLVTTANEQNEYWKVVMAACEMVFPELKGKLKHLGFGLINLTTGKISSRKGTIVDALQLVEETQEKISKDFGADSELSDKIAQAAVKYSFLKSDVFKNITFDLNTSVSREGDSGPYLLYSYVRTLGLLKDSSVSSVEETDLNEEENKLLRTLYVYPEIVEKASQIYSPHLIAGYLFDLAQKFNFFYQKHQVIKSDSKDFRLGLSAAVGQLIRNGLHLLGIEVVDKM